VNYLKYNKMLLYVGVMTLTGMLGSKEADAATVLVNPIEVKEVEVRQNPLFDIKELWRTIGAEYPYIEGLEGVETNVLQLRENENKQEPEGELMLFSRARGLEGTRVYADVTNFVNVRKKPSTSGEVVGKLYGGCVATVIEESGNWVYVNSGNVTGYVIKEYLLLGEQAEEAIAKDYTPKVQVTANVLNIRSGAGTGYDILKTVSKGAEAELLKEGTEWMKIRFSDGNTKKTGYVSAKFVKVTGQPRLGETLSEEKERIAAEKKAAAEAAAAAEAEKKAAAEQAKRSKAKQVSDYAKTAVGTAYVWGGTNMKTGVDCSGLCYSAYKKYGYTLPRVSRDMAASSALLSVTPNTTYLKAGDLVFYASGGRVDHVAMYIGAGKVVHASDYNTGVIISRYNYRTPHSAKRVIY